MRNNNYCNRKQISVELLGLLQVYPIIYYLLFLFQFFHGDEFIIPEIKNKENIKLTYSRAEIHILSDECDCLCSRYNEISVCRKIDLKRCIIVIFYRLGNQKKYFEKSRSPKVRYKSLKGYFLFIEIKMDKTSSIYIRNLKLVQKKIK